MGGEKKGRRESGKEGKEKKKERNERRKKGLGIRNN